MKNKHTIKRGMRSCIAFSLFLLLCVSKISEAQNVYDTYNPNPSTVSSLNIPSHSTHSGYLGEYQLWISKLGNWDNITNLVSYKIEPVSFPFIPDCSNGDCGDSSSTTRELIMPSNFGPNYCLFAHAFNDQYMNSDIEMGTETTLLSNGFTSPGTPSPNRDYLPHTVLKHTYYLHCGTLITDPVIDSFSFVLDHTRGEMCRYPFLSSNNQTDASTHDITVLPWVAYSNDTDFIATPPQTTNSWNTINYFPYPDPTITNNCPSAPFIPDPLYLFEDPHQFFHPSPYSVYGIVLGRAGENAFAGYDPNLTLLGGVEHHYRIDQNLDLSLINPSERIIYNPSDVDITADSLIFPSGYTFKTVGGLYPTASEVVAADPNNMYADLRDVPVYGSALHLSNNPHTTRNDSLSIYRIKNGSKLTIEQCVTIYDAEIIIDSGGTLVFDPANLEGNYIITPLSGSTIDTVIFSPTTACPYLCYEASNYNSRSVTISTNTTWTTSNIATLFPGSSPFVAVTANTISFVDGITIDSGYTLTVDSGINLLFGPRGKIIIEKDANLILNGTATNPCMLGPACQAEWQGVEVRGDRTLPQGLPTNTPQGYLYMNHTTITHSLDAVTLGDPNNFGTEGGIVRAFYSTFLNNVRDVQFLTYQNFDTINNHTIDNISYFSQCNFVTDEVMYAPSLYINYDSLGAVPVANIAHITMHDVKGVTFLSCNFRTDNPADYLPHFRGTGIFAIDAGVKLSHINPSTFENMSDAVWVKSSVFGLSAVIVWNQEFNNNIHSIVLEGTQGGWILQNDITVPSSPQFGYATAQLEKGYDKPVGIYTIGAIDFRIEENNFNVGDTSALITPGTNCEDCSYDIVINNSVVNSNGSGTVYKNVVNHSSVGLQVEGDNGVGASPIGIDVKCNSFDDLALFDFAVQGRSANPVQSNIKDQGACAVLSDQASNGFDVCTSNSEQIRIGTNAIPFLYNDYSATSLSNCADAFLFDCAFITSSPCSTNIYENHVFIGGNIVGGSELLNNSQASIALLEYDLASQLDGGNTQNILDALDDVDANVGLTAMSNLRSFVSDTVLLKALAQPDKFAGGMISILKDCSRLSPKVYAAFIASAFYYDDTDVSDVIDAQNIVNDRYSLESQLASERFSYNLHAEEVVTSAIEKDSIATAIGYFAGATTVSDLQRLFRLEFSLKDYESADTVLADIYALQGNQNTPWSVMAYATLQLYSDGLDWSHPSEEALNIADSLYQLNPEFAVNARIAVSRSKSVRWLPDPYTDATSPRMANSSINTGLKSVLDMRIYPNPNNGEILTVELPTDNYVGSISIYNATGQQVKQIAVNSPVINMPLAELAEGLYLVVYKSEKNITTQRLLIQN